MAEFSTLTLGRLARKIATSCALLSLLCGAVSCSSLQTLGNLTATQGAREGQLGPRLDKFSKAYYWASYGELAKYVSSESRSKFLRSVQKERKSRRLVAVEVQDVEFVDDSNTANVEMSIRYYEQPSYYVRTRTERQQWSYHRLSGGWLFEDREVLGDTLVTSTSSNTGARASYRDSQ